VTYRIDFTDPGELDAHTVTVDWGDGSKAQTVAMGPRPRRLELPHRYDAEGSFGMHVAVADEDGGRGETIVSTGVRALP
jgi:hypothetical protein